MTSFIGKEEIHVLGVQRTGQHAISSWVIGHFDKTCYKNGFVAHDRKGNRGLTPPWWYFDVGNQQQFVPEDNSDPLMRVGQDCILLGTEYSEKCVDFDIDMKWEEAAKKDMCERVGVDEFSQRNTYLTVIRSPWNHFASVLKWKDWWYMKKPDRFIAAWKMMAREVLGETDILPNPKVAVLFDKWFEDEDYRKSLSDEIGIEFSDRGLNNVMGVGRHKKGSSFDTMGCKGKAQSMKVTERWKQYVDDPDFLNVIRKDDELIDMAERLFGKIPF